MNGVPPPGGMWAEARNAEGRVYYYNRITKATQWTKPEELMTPAEVNIISSLRNESDPSIARPCNPTMARVFNEGRTKILVQQGEQAELVGDARCLQRSACSERTSEAFHGVGSKETSSGIDVE